MKRIVSVLVILIAVHANADTYPQSFGSSKYENKTIYIKSGGSATHTFLINGVFGNSINSFRTDWYSTEDIQHETGYIESDSSNFGNGYWDPEVTRTYSSAGTYFARGEVMTRDNVTQQFWWKETHQWRITVKVDNIGPAWSSTSGVDLSGSDDTGKSSSDNITKNTSGLSFSWPSATDSEMGMDHYEWMLDSGSWNNRGLDTSVDINANEGLHTFYVRAVDVAGNASSIKSLSFQVDTTKPNTPALSSTEPPFETVDTTPYFNWSGSDNSGGSGIWKYYILVRSDTLNWKQFDAEPTSSDYTPTSADALDAGGAGYEWYVKSYDVAGNVSSDSAVRLFYVNDPVGTVRVDILPSGAVSAGAKWQLGGYDSSSTWRNGGTSATVPVDSYTIKFNTVSLWDKPADIPINLTTDGMTKTGTYTVPVGNIKATLYNWNGEPSTAARTWFREWSLPLDAQGKGNPYSFVNIPVSADGYWIEGYQLGEFNEWEYWGSGKIQSQKNTTLSLNIIRNMPYSTGIKIRRALDNAEIGPSVEPGTELYAVIDVVNNDPDSAHDCKVEFLLDGTNGGADWSDTTASAQLAKTGGKLSFNTAHFTPGEGNYSAGFKVRMLNRYGTAWPVTDTWINYPQFTVVSRPSQVTNILISALDGGAVNPIVPGKRYVLTAEFTDVDGQSDLADAWVYLKNPNSSRTVGIGYSFSLNMKQVDNIDAGICVPDGGQPRPVQDDYVCLTHVEKEPISNGWRVKYIFWMTAKWPSSTSGLSFQGKVTDTSGHTFTGSWTSKAVNFTPLSLPAGKWTVIVHGKSNSKENNVLSIGDLTLPFGTGPQTWENSYNGVSSEWFDNISTPSNGCPDKGWAFRLGQKISRLTKTPIRIHRLKNRQTFELETWSDPRNDNSEYSTYSGDANVHNILLYEWDDPSDFIRFSDGNWWQDNWYAYATADALYALSKKQGFEDKLNTVIGYSRGGIVASDFSRRVLRDGYQNFQVVFLDAEGWGEFENEVQDQPFTAIPLSKFTFGYDLSGVLKLAGINYDKADKYEAYPGWAYIAPNTMAGALKDGVFSSSTELTYLKYLCGFGYSDYKFYAWAGARSDQYREAYSNPDRMFCGAESLPGGNDRTVEKWPSYSTMTSYVGSVNGEIDHGYFPHYLTDWGYLANDSTIGKVCIETPQLWKWQDKNDQWQGPVSLATPSQVPGEPENVLGGVFNGAITDGSAAGWTYHGGTTPFESDGIEVADGNYALKLSSHSTGIPEAQHNWMVVPSNAKTIQFSAELTGLFSEPSELSVNWIQSGSTWASGEWIDQKSDYETFSIPFVGYAGTVGRLWFGAYQDLNDQLYLDGIAFGIGNRPSIGALSANPNPVVQDAELHLLATGVFDQDANLDLVRFYYDSNTNGVYDAGSDSLFGVVNHDNGIASSWEVTTAADMPVGQYYFFAVAKDTDGLLSEPVKTASKITISQPVNQPPVITSLSDSPDPVDRGGNVILTATGVSDSDGSVARVELYHDTDNDGVYDAGDSLLGTDTTIVSETASVTVNTGALPAGTRRFFAVAYDSQGARSAATTCRCTIVQKWTLCYQVSGSGTITPNPTAGSLPDGTKVEPSAAANAGYSFDHWEANGQAVTLPIFLHADTTVTAVFVSGGGATVPPVIHVIGSQRVEQHTAFALDVSLLQGDSPVTWSLETNPDGMSIDSSGRIIWNDPAPGNSSLAVVVKASNDSGYDTKMFTLYVAAKLYNLSVTGGSGGGSYAEGEAVPIAAGEAPSGQVFDRWIGDTQYLANPDVASTSVAMPATNVSVTATYKNVSGDTVHIEGNSMWNRYVYISWQNITHVYQSGPDNAVVDTWKFDDNGDGDPRNDANRILLNGRTDTANGLQFFAGGFSGVEPGYSTNVVVNSDGSATVTFSKTDGTGQVLSSYTMKPDDHSVYGELVVVPRVLSGCFWGIRMINNVWVDWDPGEMSLYNKARVNANAILARSSNSNGEPVEGLDFLAVSNASAGVVAAIGSTANNWENLFTLESASCNVSLKSEVKMQSDFNGWGFDRQAYLQVPEDGLIPGQTYTFHAKFDAGSLVRKVNSWCYSRMDRAGRACLDLGSTVKTENSLMLLHTLPDADSVLTGDVNGDGFFEIIAVKTNTMRIYTGDGTLERTVNLPRDCFLGLLDDADGDGVLDIVLGGGGAGFASYIYKGDGTLLKTIAGQHAGGSDISMMPIGLSIGKLLVGYNAGYARTPRGVAAYDLATAGESWYYQIGPANGLYSVADMDGDGKLDMTMSSHTVHNGASGNGTTDGDMYVIVVDETGTAKLTQKYSSPSDGGSSHVFADMTGDGLYEILGFKGHDSYYHGQSKVQVFNRDGSVLNTFDGPQDNNWYGTAWAGAYAIGDLDGNGTPEIVATASPSMITYILDANLNKLSETNTTGDVQLIADLNGDGFKEIVLLSGSGLLTILDRNLHTLSTLQVGNTSGRVIASDLLGDGSIELICFTDGLYIAGLPKAGPDLTVGNVSYTPSSYKAGSALNITASEINQGAVAVTESFTVHFVLSASTNWNDASKTVIYEYTETEGLDAKETWIGAAPAVIPNMPAGNYYLGIKIDALDEVDEGNGEANNIRWSDSADITIAQNAPDGILAAWDFYGTPSVPNPVAATAAVYTVDVVPMLHRVGLSSFGSTNSFLARNYPLNSSLPDALDANKYLEFSVHNSSAVIVDGLSFCLRRASYPAWGPTGFTLRVSSDANFSAFIERHFVTGTQTYHTQNEVGLGVAGSDIYFRLYGYGRNIQTNMSSVGFAGTTNVGTSAANSGVNGTLYDLIIYGGLSPFYVAPPENSSFVKYGFDAVQPVNRIYTVSNSADVSLDWSVSWQQDWLTAIPSSGILESGKSTDVVLSVTSAVDGLADGNYEDILVFWNSLNGADQLKSVDLKIASLTNLIIRGSTRLTANSSNEYSCIAHYSDGTVSNVTGAAQWQVTGGFTGVAIDGSTCSVGEVLEDSAVTIQAEYDGLTAIFDVAIKDISPGVSSVGSLLNDQTADAEAVVYTNGYAYVACGYAGLLIFDVNDAANPVRIGAYDTEGFAKSLDVRSNLVYIADDYFGMQILDVTDPATPVLAGQYENGQACYDISVSGQYAYLAAYNNGLIIVDINDPASPKKVSGFSGATHAWGVALDGSYAYVADYTNGLKIIDVSSPDNPVLVGSYSVSQARDVAVQGGYAYVAAYTNGLEIIDVSNPAMPVYAGSYITNYSYRITLRGTVAYLANGGSGLAVLDVSTPSAPTRISSFDNNAGAANDIFISGSSAYIANDYGGLQIVDLTSMAMPALTGTYDTHRYAYDVAVKGSYAYIAAYRDGLLSVDVSNPDVPVVVSTNVWDSSSYAYRLDISGNTLYVAAYSDGLVTYDLSNPASPSLITNYDFVSLGFIQDIRVQDGYAYCINNSSSSTNALGIVDVHDPAHPVYVGGYNTGGAAYGIDVQGQYAYLASYTNGLQIFDISNPSAPVLLGSYKRSSSPYAYRVSVSGDRAYVLDVNDVLQVLDVSDPASPVLLKKVDLGVVNNLSDVLACPPYVYIAYSSTPYPENNGLWIVDLRDLNNPVVTSQATSGNGHGIAVSGKYVYLADDPKLLHAFTFGDRELTGLSIAGPLQILAHSTNEYTCFLQYTDGSTSNVTGFAAWNLTGDSFGAVLSENYLSIASMAVPTNVTVQAVYGGMTNSIQVDLTVPHHFGFSTMDGPLDAGAMYSLTLSAQDINGSTITVYQGTAALSGIGNNGSVVMSPSNAVFRAGLCAINLRVNTPDTNVRITADDGAGCVGASDPFDVVVGRVNRFVWDVGTSSKYEGLPFDARLVAWDTAGNVVSGFTGSVSLRGFRNTPLFTESFDDSDMADWVDGSGSYIRQITNEFAAGGTGSFTLIGGERIHYNGVSRTLDNLVPDEVTVLVRSSSTTNACGYFILGQGSGADAAIWFMMAPAGTLYLNNADTYGPPYEANRWYKNTFRLDWQARTVDWYVDGALVAADVPFRGATVSSLTYMALYNYHENSQAWWDEIQFVQSTSIPVSPADSGGFSEGVWAGSLTVAGAAGNMCLLVDGGSGRIGISDLFDVVSVRQDSDADGLPDAWSMLHFGKSTGLNPDAVCSNGIYTLRQAYIAGLNPHDPFGVFDISDIRSQGLDKILRWNSVSGRVYSVCWTTNLLNGFQCLESNIPWTRSSFTNTPTVPNSYYKIDVRLAP